MKKPKTGEAVKLNSRQVAQAGELLVAAEIHLRGGYAVTFAGNMPGIDVLASNIDHSRKVGIQVKTRRAGSWHADTVRDAHAREEDLMEESFWVFVDLAGQHPRFFIAPRGPEQHLRGASGIPEQTWWPPRAEPRLHASCDHSASR